MPLSPIDIRIHNISASITDLGLEPYVLQLELDGLTIVPPEVTGLTKEAIDRATSLLLEDSARITGCSFSLDDGPSQELEWPAPPFGLHTVDPEAAGETGEVTQFLLQSLASRDRVFRDIIINPVALALVEHTMQVKPYLSSSNAFIKWHGEFGYGNNLGLHADQTVVPQPWGTRAFNTNTNWCLTEYTKDDGALAYIPGSHRYQGRPPAGAHKKAIAAEALPGSLIVFHGATWHGAYPRKNPGMRLTLSNYYRHPCIQPQEDIKNGFQPDLANDCVNPDLLKEVLGLNSPAPYPTTDNTERVTYDGMGWFPHVKAG